MTTQEQLDAGVFKNMLPYPSFEELKHLSSIEAREIRRAYREHQGVLTQNLRDSLEIENGVLKHPKADTLWNLAWDQGHSAGYGEVIMHYEDMVQLLV